MVNFFEWDNFMVGLSFVSRTRTTAPGFYPALP